MIPLRIAGATHFLGAPRGWQPEKNGPCANLAVKAHGDPLAGQGWCESAWEPTPEELAILNSGGRVILRVAGWQPPVALYVEQAPHEVCA